VLELKRFRQVPLFAELSDDDLARVCGEAREVRLRPGEVLFREGETGDRAFVVTGGQLEIRKRVNEREVLLAVRGEGEVIGEMALLHQEPRSASVRARTTTDLVSIPKSALDDLLHTSPAAANAVFHTLLRRVRETNERLRHQERMVQLGTLTAGVAHELNNPAAAVQRAAEQLGTELEQLFARLSGREALLQLIPDRPPAGRNPVEVSDAEAAVEDWLAAHGVRDPWDVAPPLVEAGIGVEELARLAGDVDLDDAVRLLAAAAAVRRSAAQIATGSQRISEIVRGLRSYSYLDRAPIQDVDVVQGLEDTLLVLGHVTKGIRIVREYEPDLPTITALGGELNQVWTNLIHNACQALAEVDTPTLTLRARRDAGDEGNRDNGDNGGNGGNIVVEVEDNGPGIPAEAQERIFDAFYTTKQPGQGTGLGLHVSQRIVLEHRGDLTVQSQPGRTTFRVVLPIGGLVPAATDGGAEDTGPMTTCEHLSAVENTPKPEGGCPDCEAVGDTWVHLRFCVTCNRVGCCDDSKNRHATRHAAATGHPVLRTKEPDENWAWCVVHETGVTLPEP
jgi:signal transduction histidine kinase